MSTLRNKNFAKSLIWEAIDKIEYRDVLDAMPEWYDDYDEIHVRTVLKYIYSAKIDVTWDD